MSMQSVAQALESLLAAAIPPCDMELLPLLQAEGRVLAEPLYSAISVPLADNTQMDGYAVRAADCVNGDACLPVSQRIPAGHLGVPLAPGTAARIFTGATIPPGADAVVMQEMCSEENGMVTVRAKPQMGEWVRRAGEDIQAGAQILAAGTRLGPAQLGMAASVGLALVPVWRPLRVAVFFTGDELQMPGEPLRPGAIYNSNRFFLRALLEKLGVSVSDLGIVPDSLAATRASLRAAAQEHDLILTSGGVSVGDEDHVKPALEAEGSLQMWQIAIKPGKPLAYGRVRRAEAELGEAHFVGLPGNPVSAFVTFLMFVRPFVLRLQGAAEVAPVVYQMRADFDWSKPDKRNEFLRVKCNAQGGLDLYPHQGSAVLSSLAACDGLLDNPPGQAIARGDLVRFLPFSSLFN